MSRVLEFPRPVFVAQSSINIEMAGRYQQLVSHGFIFFLCSALFSAGVTAIGLLTALRMVGFNLEPIMAIGGVSTIFIGFGSQILTANAVSGVDLVRKLKLGSSVVGEGQAHHPLQLGMVQKTALMVELC